jgi:hypothetical protein
MSAARIRALSPKVQFLAFALPSNAPGEKYGHCQDSNHGNRPEPQSAVSDDHASDQADTDRAEDVADIPITFGWPNILGCSCPEANLNEPHLASVAQRQPG